MKISTILPFFCAALIGVAQGASYSDGFDPGIPFYNAAFEVAGQNNWTISDNAPDLSFFVNLNGSNAAALGGFFSPPNTADARLAHASVVALSGASAGVDFAIVSSTNQFPNRDTFAFSFQDASSSNLLTVQFIPATNDANLWNIAWTTGGGSPQATGWAVNVNAVYNFGVNFTDTGGGNGAFAATVVGANTFNFNGALPGVGGSTIDTVGANYIKGVNAAGDNYIAFDNLSVVPEPSTSAVLLGAAALSLGARRRKLV